MTDALAVSRPGDGPVTLVFHGPLAGATAAAVWTRSLKTARDPGHELVFDLSAVTACDGVGLAAELVGS